MHLLVLYYRILIIAKICSMSIGERNECETHFKMLAMSRATSIL